MSLPAFYHDAYLTELDTVVVDAGETDGRQYAVLEDTIFYPEGGGQPADRGLLGRANVLDVQKTGDEIRHYLSNAAERGPVRLELDWQRRWDHMQQHTAQHVLTAVALQNFAWRTTAFHLGPTVSDIELDVPKIEARDVARLESAVAKEIRAARAIAYRSAEVADFERLGVRSRRLPEGFTGEVRLVEIEGLDLNTCGGTHVRSTAEIGTLCLLGTEPMRGGARLFFVAGDRVRKRMTDHEERNWRLRSLLDTGDDELAEVVELRLAREKELARTTRLLSEELAESAASMLAANTGVMVEAHWQNRDMPFLQRIARRLAEEAPDKRALLTSDSDPDPVFVVFAGERSGVDPADVGPRIAEILDGRGGGRSPIFQGKAGSLERRDEALAILRNA
jgi:alanyl-tRNA synthetase